MRDGVVDAVEVAVYTIPTDAPEGDGTLTWDSTTMVLVQARSGDTVGLGWTYGPAACATMITDKLAGIVAGRSVLDVGGSFDAMVKAVRNAGRPGAVGYAISAVDVALWDLKARLLDLPLHRLLGAVREKVPVYGSGGFTTYDEAQLHEQLTHWVDEQQIPRVKIKIGESWGGDAVRDLRRMTQARRIIGADVELFVDANGGYGRKQAIRVMHAAADLDVRWFEEPVSSDDLDGLREVRDAVWPDVTAGEYGYDLYYFRRMCAADAVDCLQADVSRCGGITEWLRVSAFAASFGLQVSGHCGPHLHVHAAAATPNLRHLEWFEELRVIGVGAGRAGVHGRRGEPAHLVEQVCFGVVGQVMSLGQGEVGGDGGVDLGAQGVPDPADAELTHFVDAAHAGHGGGGLVDQYRVDGVHQAGGDLTDGGAQHPEDRDGDGQADGGVGPGPPEGDTAGAEQDCEAGESVGAGMQPVGDQGGGADAAPDADAVAGHQFVAGEPDDGSSGDGPQVGDVAGVQQAVDGLVGSQGAGQGDHRDDEDPGKVFGAAVAVGVALGRRAQSQAEGDQQRNSGEGVGHVVQGVAEQGHRPRQHDDHGLDDGGGGEDGQAQQQGAAPVGVGFQGLVDLIGDVVGVRPEHL